MNRSLRGLVDQPIENSAPADWPDAFGSFTCRISRFERGPHKKLHATPHSTNTLALNVGDSEDRNDKRLP